MQGVIVKALVTHQDERGFFREILRIGDPCVAEAFGQFSHSLVHEGVIKAWHGHLQQTQWTYVASGLLKVAVHDRRQGSATIGQTNEWLLGDNQPAAVYSLPPGVLHGYVVLVGPAHVFYVTSGTYDPAEEVRLAHDHPAIGYDWSARSKPV